MLNQRKLINMVTLPDNFTMTKYPGYFWNVLDKKLYSIKVTGELKPLVFSVVEDSMDLIFDLDIKFHTKVYVKL